MKHEEKQRVIIDYLKDLIKIVESSQNIRDYDMEAKLVETIPYSMCIDSDEYIDACHKEHRFTLEVIK